jgi:hypothetical protein
MRANATAPVTLCGRMRASLGHVRRRTDVVVALALAAVYALAIAQLLQGRFSATNLAVMLIPVAVAPLVVLRRTPLPRAQALALGGTSTVTAALIMALFIGSSPVIGVAIPVLAVTAVLCARFPAVAVSGVFLTAGAFGSIAAFTPGSGQQIADLLLAGMWLAAIWGWTVSGRQRPVWMWPGVALLAVYVLLSAAEILTAASATAGLQSFRASIWYLAAVLLVAYAPWGEGARARALRLVTLAIALIGGYATLRWAIGPAPQEREQAERILNNFLDKTLRPVGSFSTSKELAAWMAMTVPFAAGIAITSRGRMRLVATAALALSVVGMLAADVRAGPGAAVPGVAVVLLVYSLSQAFRGRRGPTIALAVAATVLGGAGAFALTLGDNNDSGRRYQAILDPASDASYQARLIKWRTAIADIDSKPLGHGLGTTGRVEKRYGEFRNIGSIDVDNSYLKIAYEQGFMVLALFALAMGLLLVGLARRAIVSLDPARAGPAIAACGTLTAMLVIFYVGDYVEGLPALGGWLLVGFGVSQFTGAVAGPDDDQASAA